MFGSIYPSGCQRVSFAAAFILLTGAVFCQNVRSIDGSGNNLADPDLGKAHTQLLRGGSVAYGDGISTPAPRTVSARLVSSTVCDQDSSILAASGASSFVFQWGQFLDHDLDLTEGADPAEPFDILVPMGDPFFDPFNTGIATISLNRSIFDPATGIMGPREQLNEITSFIDASNVYGSDPVRAAALRRHNGSGKLKMSAHRLLPFNNGGLPNAGGTDPSLYLAGDVRANEQIGLASMHTLFVREHNRLAKLIRLFNWWLDDDEIYERARAIVGAQMQVITYNEFLPVLLGPNALDSYNGYSDSVDPSVSNEFSTVAYRVGHTMLSSTLLRLKRNGNPIPQGNLALRDAFFAPDELLPQNGKGIEPLLRGLAQQTSQEVDVFIVDDVRNFLFGPPGAGGFDLASLNIQRGRDHGLPDYNTMRVDYGLAPVASFADISSNLEVQQRLAAAYATVDDIDPWVGGLAEDHVSGAMVGPLFHAIIKDQFERLRDGDRFYYENVFGPAMIWYLESTTLAKIIERNTRIRKNELQSNVFLAPGN